jgi:hypothetical protein
LRVRLAKKPQKKTRDEKLPDITPTDKVMDIVTAIEEEEFGDSRWKETVSAALGKVRDGYLSGVTIAKDATFETALWTTTILSDREFARGIEQWMGETFNTVTNAYTKAMDGAFAVTGPIAGDITSQPIWHRLLEGHTPVEAWDAVRDALPNDTFTEEFIGYLTALGSDMASSTGLPIFTFTEDAFEFVQSIATELGLSDRYLNDILHINGVEILTIPVIAAALAWGKPDQEQFSKLAGSLGIAGAYSGNPVLIVMALVMAAWAYQQAKDSGDPEKWAAALAKGGFLSGLLFSVSAAIGGPAWVGLLAGICVLILAKKVGSPISMNELLKFIRRLSTKPSPA